MKRDSSLMIVHGEASPSPPDKYRNRISRTGAAKRSVGEEDSQTSSGTSSRTAQFFRKPTLTQWTLAITMLLVAGLGTGLIVVLVGNNEKPRGDAPISGQSNDVSLSPPAVDLSPTSPDIAPSPLQNLGAPSPTPSPSQKPVSPPPTPSPTTLLAPTVEPNTNQPTVFLESETLEIIFARGYLKCGVTPGLDGFSTLNGDSYEGFEADLCRAIAAAVLGSPDDLQFVEVNKENAFIALQVGSVDVLANHVTHTMEGDVFEPSAEAAFTFSAPYLYDGLTFGGASPFVDCADKLLYPSVNCTDLIICVLDGSSFGDTIEELMPGVRQVSLPSMASVYTKFNENTTCNVIAGAGFDVSEHVVKRNGYRGDSYKVGDSLFSPEPLVIVTRDDDARWSDMVQWVLQALFAAEEKGISADMKERFMNTQVFGDSFTNLFRNAIGAVGNYGDMYDRNLNGIVPRTSINMINKGYNSPLILAFSFGNLQTIGPGPIEGGTLKKILDRGHLNCGIARVTGFAEFNATTGAWSGFDVDFCRAVSAAIFNGVTDNVYFQDLPATERFVALADYDVDLLSRFTTWNLERDVKELVTGVGYSFSQPIFYDRTNVGGLPEYVKCADDIDTNSDGCLDLKICVLRGTTTLELIKDRFPGRVIVPRLTTELMVDGLASGDCNVIAGGTTEVAEYGVRNYGYTGPYEVGQIQFSKEPLSLVTRQDDPQFTAFVNWIVSATFYAEEQGITEESAEGMPFTFLFGPRYHRMLIDAIQAVGNYGEIYSRSLQELVARGGQNDANGNPFGPQIYPLI